MDSVNLAKTTFDKAKEEYKMLLILEIKNQFKAKKIKIVTDLLKKENHTMISLLNTYMALVHNTYETIFLLDIKDSVVLYINDSVSEGTLECFEKMLVQFFGYTFETPRGFMVMDLEDDIVKSCGKNSHRFTLKKDMKLPEQIKDSTPKVAEDSEEDE